MFQYGVNKMVILYIVLALIVVLVTVLAFNTVKASKKARKLTEFKPFYNDDEIKSMIDTVVNEALDLRKENRE